MVIAITYGSYDLLHEGHLRLLRRARKHCDFLIVGLSTEEFQEIKGKEPMHQDYKTRYDALLNSGLVNIIIPERSWEQKKEDIKAFQPDFLFMGSDWAGNFHELGIPVMIFPRTEGISSTELRRQR